MAVVYLFFNCNRVLAYKISFQVDRDNRYKDFNLCSIYRSNQPLWKDTALHKLIPIIENWRIKSSKNYPQNHAVLGLCFFFQIALVKRLVVPFFNFTLSLLRRITCFPSSSRLDPDEYSELWLLYNNSSNFARKF